MSTLHLIDHPLVQHKLTLMRRKEASTNSFRRMLGELSTLMAYELTRDFRCRTSRSRRPWKK
jgi:uracil phosphoribosyltransferase